MNKTWVIVATASSVLLALGAGTWIGAVYRDRIESELGVSSPTRPKAAGDRDRPAEITAISDHPAPLGKTLFHCGMHPWIIQDHPGSCPICHMELTPIAGAMAQTEPAEMRVLYYWDPALGAASISEKPGKSATGIDLMPVYRDQVSGGTAITIDPAVVQNMGVQTAEVRKGTLTKSLRTVGYLEVPETGLYDITLKVNGYIDKLYANETGMHIHKGDPLFDLYSPDLVAAEDELIAARKSVDGLASASPEVRSQAQRLLESARRRLQLLDVPEGEIDAIAKQDHAERDITIHSPAEGHLEDKAIVQGTAVQAGMKLLRMEDHSKLWLEAQVYEEQLPLVAIGEAADATLDALPGKTYSGKIIFINPHLNHMTRTVTVRVELDNAELSLKPGMYATVQIHGLPLEDAILAPREAVIDTGVRKIAFVQEAEGHFAPRLVTTGISGDGDQLQILSGLAPGETVVTSGQFLMDVESRTQEAIQKLQTSGSGTGDSTDPAMTEMAVPASAPASTTAPTTGTATRVRSTGLTDDVTKAYLQVAEHLQTAGAAGQPVDVTDLLSATQALAKVAPADEQPLAQALADAIAPMKGQPLDQQHKTFEKVGAAIIPIIEKDPPSAAVAPTLYVINCPMEKADWLQTQAAVGNPFLPSMPTCGSVTQTLSLSPTK